MASAPGVLRAAVEEGAQLARSGGTLAELQSLALLALAALDAGDGAVADAEVRKSALRASRIQELVARHTKPS